MRITPKTDDEIKLMKIVPDGEYYFKIIKAEEKQSKSSGNPMIVINLVIWDEKGRERYITDYLIDNENLAFKIRHLYECIGMIEEYESGNLDPINLLGKDGHAKIIIQKDKKGIYDDKNVVKDYVKKIKNGENLIPDELNDELPF